MASEQVACWKDGYKSHSLLVWRLRAPFSSCPCKMCAAAVLFFTGLKEKSYKYSLPQMYSFENSNIYPTFALLRHQVKENMAPVLTPSFTPFPAGTPEPPNRESLLTALHLEPHVEGGYFVETDRAPDTVPTPFPSSISTSITSDLAPQRPGFDPQVRNSSTTIFYLLTPNSPQGGFHRNKGRTVHTLHRGRGRYVLIHAMSWARRSG
jgi:hypothetical protein